MTGSNRINSKKKGSRVELELVHWLKERGVVSARRTQQFSGKEGTSDVVAPDELPSFHIEVKGTAGAKLEKSKLKKWVEQICRDKVSNSLPVIFHKANNHPWVAIFRAEECGFLYPNLENVHLSLEDFIEPAHHLSKIKDTHYVALTLSPMRFCFECPAVAYRAASGVSVVALFAEDLLPRMLSHEARIKAN